MRIVFLEVNLNCIVGHNQEQDCATVLLCVTTVASDDVFQQL